MTISCPICKKPLGQENQKYRPFCSKRCKLMDLGNWLDGNYAIPGEPAEIPENVANHADSDDDPDSGL